MLKKVDLLKKLEEGELTACPSSTCINLSSISTTSTSLSSSLSSSSSLSTTTAKSASSSSAKSSHYKGTNLCLRLQKFITINPTLNYLLPISVVIIIVFFIYFCKDYFKQLLFWIETQNSWMVFLVFMFLFTIVSFPITIGYLVLIITSGYLFGIIKGLLTVILGANLGIFIAHNTIKSLQKKIPVHKLIKNETGRAILRVIAGPRAFKVVLFARLTPIPFGLQNTIFGVSAVNSRSYHTATIIGLFPAQAINVYLGSTLRSMHDVLNDHNTAVAGYCIFALQVLIGVSLMVWVVKKARTELSTALMSDMDIEHNKLLLIDVDS